MKKMLYALCLMAGLAVVACEQEEAFVPHVDFQPAEVTIPTAGTEELAEPVTFSFTANAAWTATLTGEAVGEWLSITPKSGEAGDAVITFNATANTTKNDRVATLEIALEGLDPVLVTVTQLQKNAIDVIADAEYKLSFKGETVEVEVGHNVGYTYEVVYADGVEPWLVETKAYATDKLVFTAPEQAVNAPARAAALYIYSELGVVKTIVITQEAWTPMVWTKSLSELGATAGRVAVAVVGDKVYFTSGGELWAADAATGAGAAKVTLPEGFIAGGVHVDDAGNLMVSGEDRAPGAGQLQLFKVAADGTYTALVDYDSANYWCTEMGNFRVKGDVNGDALIMAYICVGTGHYAVWEVKGGVVAADPVYGDLPTGSWDAATGVVAPAGATLADGFFSITYGAPYDIYYYNGAEWTAIWDDPTEDEWMENYNCISTAEVNGNKYLAITASCHFDYDYTDIIVLDLTAGKEVFRIQMNFHTVNADGLTYSDIFIKGENGKLAAYVVDSWMDTVEKYEFPL